MLHHSMSLLIGHDLEQEDTFPTNSSFTSIGTTITKEQDISVFKMRLLLSNDAEFLVSTFGRKDTCPRRDIFYFQICRSDYFQGANSY